MAPSLPPPERVLVGANCATKERLRPLGQALGPIGRTDVDRVWMTPYRTSPPHCAPRGGSANSDTVGWAAVTVFA